VETLFAVPETEIALIAPGAALGRGIPVTEVMVTLQAIFLPFRAQE
jgi:hypothetical protein